MAKKVEFSMDVVKRYVFWACAPIGLVVAVFAGYLAIGSIADELEKQKQLLENQKTTMGRLRGEATTHPNQGTIDAINQERDRLVENVFAAWDILEREQRGRNHWAGLARVAQEEIAGKNFLDPLSSTTLNSYLLFARNAINGDGTSDNPGLLVSSNIRRVQQYALLPDGRVGPPVETILLTENRGDSSFGGGGGGISRARPSVSATTSGTVSGPTTLRGKVVWDSPGLDVTMKNWTQQPQSFEVWLTQEDLWVYQALLWVVAESNKGVAEDGIVQMAGGAGLGSTSGTGGRLLNLRDSVVKEIIELAIGRKAAMELDKQSSRRFSAGLGAGMDGMGGMGMGGGGSFGGSDALGGGFGGGFGSTDGGMMGGAAGAENARREAMAGRYVDATGTPLMEPELTGQFRRMPVYLNLRVDQRYISDVLVNCANCPMPIDVLWVTISPDATRSFDFVSATGTGMTSGGFSSSGGGGFGDSSFGSSRSGMGSSGTARFSGTGGSRGRASGNVDFGLHEVVIEIFGCINIFTPPEVQKIGGETSGI